MGLEAGLQLSSQRRAAQSSQEGALIAEHGAEALRAPLAKDTQEKKKRKK